MQSLTKSALDINCFYLAKEGADFKKNRLLLLRAFKGGNVGFYRGVGYCRLLLLGLGLFALWV